MIKHEYMRKIFTSALDNSQDEQLEQLGNDRWRLISVVTQGSAIVMYLERQKIIQIKSSVSSFPFDEVYKEYPRKEGKSQGFRVFNAQIKDEQDFVSLKQAVDNYKKHLLRKGTESKFIMMFSTFMNQWRDWISVNAGKIETPKHAPRPLPKPPETANVDPKIIEELTKGLKKGLFK